MARKYIQPQASMISVCKNFEKYINSIDFTGKIYSTTEILNLDKAAEQEIICYPSILLSLEFINQIALLFPIIYESPSFNKQTFLNTQKQQIPELFIECDSSFNYKKNKQGVWSDNSNSYPIQGFRNSIEHGKYKLIFDENDNKLYYCFKYIHRKKEYYAKIPYDKMMSMIDDMISSGLNEKNRLAVAVVNNMKLLITLMSQSDNSMGNTINDYQRKFPSLNNALIISETNKNTVLEDMKMASTCSLFYATYQKELEELFGPSIYQLKHGALDDERVEQNVLSDSYFDLSAIPISWEFNGRYTENESKDILTKIIPKYIRLHNENSKRYEDGLITLVEFKKRNRELTETHTRLLKYRKKLEILHHIRNSFAHGRTIIADHSIYFTDVNPSNNKCSYKASMRKDSFKDIVSHDKVSRVVNYSLSAA